MRLLALILFPNFLLQHACASSLLRPLPSSFDDQNNISSFVNLSRPFGYKIEIEPGTVPLDMISAYAVVIGAMSSQGLEPYNGVLTSSLVYKKASYTEVFAKVVLARSSYMPRSFLLQALYDCLEYMIEYRFYELEGEIYQNGFLLGKVQLRDDKALLDATSPQEQNGSSTLTARSLPYTNSSDDTTSTNEDSMVDLQTDPSDIRTTFSDNSPQANPLSLKGIFLCLAQTTITISRRDHAKCVPNDFAMSPEFTSTLIIKNEKDPKLQDRQPIFDASAALTAIWCTAASILALPNLQLKEFRAEVFAGDVKLGSFLGLRR